MHANAVMWWQTSWCRIEENRFFHMCREPVLSEWRDMSLGQSYLLELLVAKEC